MLQWLHRIYLKWRDRPVADKTSNLSSRSDHYGARVINFKPDNCRLYMNGREVLPVDMGDNHLRPTPVDHYSASLKATQHALHEALMGHSARQQAEADAVRSVGDDARRADDLPTLVFLLVRTESGYTKMPHDEHRESKVMGVYRSRERADNTQAAIVAELTRREAHHAYYFSIEEMKLL